jgi:hypothetical protein
MFSWFITWRPVRKIAAVIWIGLIGTVGAALDAADVIDWQSELVDKLGAWSAPVAIGIAALMGYARRAIPDEQSPPAGDVPEIQEGGDV